MDLSVRAHAAGAPVALVCGLSVDALAAESSYFDVLLGGGFRETLLVEAGAPVPIVLPLGQGAHDPAAVGALLTPIATRSALPHHALVAAYWDALRYVRAHRCLRASAAVLDDALDFWRCDCAHCDGRSARSSPPTEMPDAHTMLCIYAAHAVHGTLDDDAWSTDAQHAADEALTEASDSPSAAVRHPGRPARGDDGGDVDTIDLPRPTSSVYNTDRMWNRGAIEGGGDNRSECMCFRAKVSTYAMHGMALIEAHDAAATRMRRRARGESQMSGVEIPILALDAIIGDDMGLLSVATSAALRDWHQPLAPVASHLALPYCLALYDPVEAASVGRFAIGASADDCRLDSPPAEIDEADEALAHDGDTRKMDEAMERPHAPVVDSREAFVEALVDAHPRTARAVLSVIGRGDVVVAGGAAVEALLAAPLRAKMADADIDLWVVGPDEAAREDSLGRVLKGLSEALPDHRMWVRGCVVTFAPRDCNRDDGPDRVQVVHSGMEHAGDVIHDFDMAHTGAYFDGAHIRMTWRCLWAVVTRRTDVLPGIPCKADRMAKARSKGFRPLDHMAARVSTAPQSRAIHTGAPTPCATIADAIACISRRHEGRLAYDPPSKEEEEEEEEKSGDLALDDADGEDERSKRHHHGTIDRRLGVAVRMRPLRACACQGCIEGDWLWTYRYSYSPHVGDSYAKSRVGRRDSVALSARLRTRSGDGVSSAEHRWSRRFARWVTDADQAAARLLEPLWRDREPDAHEHQVEVARSACCRDPLSQPRSDTASVTIHCDQSTRIFDGLTRLPLAAPEGSRSAPWVAGRVAVCEPSGHPSRLGLPHFYALSLTVYPARLAVIVAAVDALVTRVAPSHLARSRG